MYVFGLNAGLVYLETVLLGRQVGKLEQEGSGRFATQINSKVALSCLSWANYLIRISKQYALLPFIRLCMTRIANSISSCIALLSRLLNEAFSFRDARKFHCLVGGGMAGLEEHRRQDLR